MADGAITGIAAALLGGSVGVTITESLRSIRQRHTHRLAETKAPSEIEATVSAGAKDAVTALREVLAELRSELTELRDKCDQTEARNSALAEELRTERARGDQLTVEVTRLKRRLEEATWKRY